VHWEPAGQSASTLHVAAEFLPDEALKQAAAIRPSSIVANAARPKRNPKLEFIVCTTYSRVL
jgi:hypothetical protein